MKTYKKKNYQKKRNYRTKRRKSYRTKKIYQKKRRKPYKKRIYQKRTYKRKNRKGGSRCWRCSPFNREITDDNPNEDWDLNYDGQPDRRPEKPKPAVLEFKTPLGSHWRGTRNINPGEMVMPEPAPEPEPSRKIYKGSPPIRMARSPSLKTLRGKTLREEMDERRKLGNDEAKRVKAEMKKTIEEAEADKPKPAGGGEAPHRKG